LTGIYPGGSSNERPYGPTEPAYPLNLLDLLIECFQPFKGVQEVKSDDQSITGWSPAVSHKTFLTLKVN